MASASREPHLLAARGVAHQVVHGTSSSTSYETIPPVRLEGDLWRHAVDRRHGGATSRSQRGPSRRSLRRDGPRWLRELDDDDDDDDESD